jgi:hypothetical protein
MAQQNSFNPSPDNPALEKCGPKNKGFAFYQKKASSMKQADLTDMLIKASKNVCAATVVASPEHVSPSPSTSSPMKTPEKDTDTLNQHMDISKWNTLLINCAAQVQEQ